MKALQCNNFNVQYRVSLAFSTFSFVLSFSTCSQAGVWFDSFTHTQQTREDEMRKGMDRILHVKIDGERERVREIATTATKKRTCNIERRKTYSWKLIVHVRQQPCVSNTITKNGMGANRANEHAYSSVFGTHSHFFPYSAHWYYNNVVSLFHSLVNRQITQN